MAAESLSKHKGYLRLDLDQISESAAAILGKHPSFAESDEDDEEEDYGDED